MSNIAKIAQGSLIMIGNGAGSEVFTVVPGIQRMSTPGTRFDLKDVTDHDDADFFREFIAGLSDGETIALSGNWRPTNSIHIGLRNDNINATRRNFKFVLADTGSGNTCIVSCFVTEHSGDANTGEPFGQNTRLKVVGQPVWV